MLRSRSGTGPVLRTRTQAGRPVLARCRSGRAGPVPARAIHGIAVRSRLRLRISDTSVLPLPKLATRIPGSACSIRLTPASACTTRMTQALICSVRLAADPARPSWTLPVWAVSPRFGALTTEARPGPAILAVPAVRRLTRPTRRARRRLERTRQRLPVSRLPPRRRPRQGLPQRRPLGSALRVGRPSQGSPRQRFSKRQQSRASSRSLLASRRGQRATASPAGSCPTGRWPSLAHQRSWPAPRSSS
jgi:hypothetical protein